MTNAVEHWELLNERFKRQPRRLKTLGEAVTGYLSILQTIAKSSFDSAGVRPLSANRAEPIHI